MEVQFGPSTGNLLTQYYKRLTGRTSNMEGILKLVFNSKEEKQIPFNFRKKDSVISDSDINFLTDKLITIYKASKSDVDAADLFLEFLEKMETFNGGLIQKDDPRFDVFRGELYKIKGYNCKDKNEQVDLFTRAFKCFEKSINIGNSDGYYNLGLCYMNAEGTEPKIDKAFDCFKKSVSMSNARGIEQLAKCYLLGNGVEKAINLFNQNSYQDIDLETQVELAYCYLFGCRY